MTPMTLTTPCIAVIGLGNVFLGDDGFGPLAVEIFRSNYHSDLSVEIFDLGTPGLDLAPYLCDRKLIVLLDAIESGAQPGTLSIFCEDDFVSSRARLRITGHDPGLWESLAHLRLAGRAPAELIIVGVSPRSCAFGEAIDAGVIESAWDAAETVGRSLAERGVACRRCDATIQPDLWWLHKADHHSNAHAKR